MQGSDEGPQPIGARSPPRAPAAILRAQFSSIIIRWNGLIARHIQRVADNFTQPSTVPAGTPEQLLSNPARSTSTAS
jgi:hypothetical protein